MIVKGATIKIQATVYEDDLITPANLTGADIQIMFKKNARDLDANALFSVTPSILSAGNGTIEGVVAASQTNDLSFKIIYFEIVAKIGTVFIRSGIEELELEEHVLKTLY